MSLIQKVQSFGFEVDNLILDGHVHRFKTASKPRKKNGWYVGRKINLRGGRSLEIVTVGDWALGETQTFTSRDDLNEADRKMFSAAAKKMQDDMRKQQAEEHSKVSEAATLEWENAKPVSKGFQYLQKKKIETLKPIDFIRENKNKRLLIPLFNREGKIRSLQTIAENGEKLYLTGGEVKGNFFPMKGTTSEACIVCEGFATGVSIYAALESRFDVIIAFQSNNLFNVTSQMVAEYGADNVWVASDDDRYNGHNAGIEASEKCKELGVKVIVPRFASYDSKPTDFNDLHCLEGLDEIYSQFQEAGFFGKLAEVIAPAPDVSSNEIASVGPELWPSKEIGFYVVVPQKNGQMKLEPRYHELSKYLHYGLSVRISDKEELIFNGTHYEQLGRNSLLGLIHKLTMDRSSPEHFEKFVKIVRAECDEGNYSFSATDGLINLKNGVFNIRTKELLSHSPIYDFRYCLPYDVDLGANCPLWEKFLNEIFEGDRELISVVQEIFGYTLIGGEPFLHKAFMLYGTGRNGKSVFLKVLQAIIGEGNYSNVPIESLDEKHVKASMIGKLANISPETSKKGIESATFKGIVGGDEISDRHLYHGFFSFRLTCRMFFSGNFFPRFGDNSVGLNERLFILPFKRFFKPEEQDRGLFKKLNGELSGIFNWALAGAERLLERGSLPYVTAVDDMADEYRKESDSVYAFFKEKCKTGLCNEPTVLGNFYEAYKTYCDDNDIRARREKKGFCMVLKNLLSNEFGHGATEKNRLGFLETKFLRILDKNESSETNEMTRRDLETKRRVIQNYAPQGKNWYDA